MWLNSFPVGGNVMTRRKYGEVKGVESGDFKKIYVLRLRHKLF
jgi:hypothetical protein